MALKILLADDNITAQKMGCKILTDAGYQVVAVSNGAAAMKKVASEKPELMILDVFMPGYSGLEVCQKVKSAPETAAVPVVLTVTNMEPFNPEDGNRVKADGVMIKPFEASDLLAIVQKFEAKLHPPAPSEPEYEKTVKMPAMEFKDASYEEWKAEASPGEEAAQRLVVSQEMGASPAMGLEDMLVEAPPRAVSSAEPAGFALEDTQPVEAPSPFLDLEAAPAFAEATAEAVVTPAPGVEFTSAPQVGEIEVAPAPELELNGHAAAAAATADIVIVQDPALVTDAADMAQFVTKFSDAPDRPSFVPTEQPAEGEAIAAIPEIAEPAESAAPAVSFEAPVEEAPAVVEAEPVQAEPQPVQFEPEPAAQIEPAPVQEIPQQAESGAASLEEEMRRAFDAGGGAAAAPALAPEPEPVAEPEPVMEAAPFVDVAPEPAPVVEAPPPPAAAIPDRLVEQFAAELAQAEEVTAEVAPPEPVAEAAAPAPEPVAALDEQRVSEAVQRVMSRYKDELVAAIVRELKS